VGIGTLINALEYGHRVPQHHYIYRLEAADAQPRILPRRLAG